MALLPSVLLFAAAATADPPAPAGPVPAPRQLAWHALEFYAFVHFNMNTFTDVEWGEGRESPETFLPTDLDCRQWAEVARAAGMRGIILTAKHHDGFCLWPSGLTEHDVASSPWREGRGDVLRDLSEACREAGLKFGVYLSPWDRNNPLYGDSESYNDAFARQLEEVLSGYGPVFEVWFDGACGEGPTGRRQVYDWPRFVGVVRRLQPDAVIFSDAGPDVRWVGNERGFAAETNWCRLDADRFYPGTPDFAELSEGHENGSHWLPAECDVSIRPGWYYHPAEDERVKSLGELQDIWYGSVGRGANLLLNLPVDRRGRVHENDAARLAELRAALDATFGVDLLRGAPAAASDVRGGDARFGAAAAVDGDPATYWATNDAPELPALPQPQELTVRFAEPTALDRVWLAEAIALGQRVQAFRVDAEIGGRWCELARGTTVGARRILRTPAVRATALRAVIEDAKACPTLATFAAFASPAAAEQPIADLLRGVTFVRAPAPGIAWRRYAGRFGACAEIEGGEPAAAGVGETVALSGRAPGAPAVPGGIVLRGVLQVPSDGIFRFALAGAGCARLFLGSSETPAVELAGTGAELRAERSLGLRAGWHLLRVEGVDPGGEASLAATWSRPGAAEEPLPASALFH